MAAREFWLTGYVPSLFGGARDPSIEVISGYLAGTTRVSPVPIPFDCVDGFIEAFYGRPQRLLDPDVRSAQSAWAFAEPHEVVTGLGRLTTDLRDGAWDQRFGDLRRQPEYVGSLRLIVSHRS